MASNRIRDGVSDEYRTSDRSVFSSLLEALEHETRTQLEADLAACETKEDVIRRLVEHPDQVLEILQAWDAAG